MNFNTDKMIKWSWLAFAASLPLFGVSFLRLDLWIYHFTPAAFFTLGIAALSAIQGRATVDTIQQNLSRQRGMIIFSILVVLTHGLAVFRSDYLQYGVKEFLKLGLAAVNFLVILALFPVSKPFFKRFVQVASLSSAGLFAMLIFFYAFVFKAAYLGTTPMFETMVGKNHIAWFAAVIQPYAALVFLMPQLGALWALINVTLGVGLIYTMSRSAWIAALVFALYFLITAVRRRVTLNRKALILFVCGLVLGVAGLFAAVPALRDEMSVRVRSIYQPQTLPDTPQAQRLGKNSYAKRGHILRLAFEGFLQKPFLGHGLSDSQHLALGIDQSAHNDYLNVCFETGLLGGLVFFLFLSLIAWKLFCTRSGPDPALAIAARGSFLAMLILSNFIDIYTSVQYWVFLALALKAVEIDAPSETAEPV